MNSINNLIDTDSMCSSNLLNVPQLDKVWLKHRSNADQVSQYYIGTQFQDYAFRINECSELLNFHIVDLGTDQISTQLKLNTARFCRVRYCPVCQWRRSLMWKAKAYSVLPRIVADYPTSRWLFITLNVRNCLITELRVTLDWMHQSFKRLTKLKDFPAFGWLKSTEVTRSKDNSAHPHFHCLLMVKSSYFGKNYLKQSDWLELWRHSLRTNYSPVLHIQALKKDKCPSEIIPELLKYCTKESDLIIDKDWFLELTRQMQKARTISTGGVVKEYLKQLMIERENLISDDNDTSSFEDKEHLYFKWNRISKKYNLFSE